MLRFLFYSYFLLQQKLMEYIRNVKLMSIVDKYGLLLSALITNVNQFYEYQTHESTQTPNQEECFVMLPK
uniref:Uncharacterized protein n=1 Tax=Medicago truncatula TaxID=3880 RepID=I3S9P2_MEDTR|nr:unknown [Medicago truncatula]